MQQVEVLTVRTNNNEKGRGVVERRSVITDGIVRINEGNPLAQKNAWVMERKREGPKSRGRKCAAEGDGAYTGYASRKTTEKKKNEGTCRRIQSSFSRKRTGRETRGHRKRGKAGKTNPTIADGKVKGGRPKRKGTRRRSALGGEKCVSLAPLKSKRGGENYTWRESARGEKNGGGPGRYPRTKRGQRAKGHSHSIRPVKGEEKKQPGQETVCSVPGEDKAKRSLKTGVKVLTQEGSGRGQRKRAPGVENSRRGHLSSRNESTGTGQGPKETRPAWGTPTGG